MDKSLSTKHLWMFCVGNDHVLVVRCPVASGQVSTSRAAESVKLPIVHGVLLNVGSRGFFK